MQQQLIPDDYKVNLEVFEGPLDLLLYLIRKDELDIYDIPIDKIADQYTEYVQTMRMLDLNMAGEFIVMAATLALIKSRLLLPSDETAAGDEGDEEGKDPRWDLVRQLVAYKKYKDAADDLLRREFDQQNVFSPAAPTVAEEDLAEEKSLGEIGLFDLIDAFNNVLARAEVEPISVIEPIRWTVPDKIDLILELTSRAAEGAGVRFSTLFSPESPRGEIIVTFLALLELLRLRQVSVAQPAHFAEIEVCRVEPGDDETLPPQVIGGNDHVET